MSCSKAEHFEVAAKLSETSVKGSVFSIMLFSIELCSCGLICILVIVFVAVRKENTWERQIKERRFIYHLQFEDVDDDGGGGVKAGSSLR